MKCVSVDSVIESLLFLVIVFNCIEFIFVLIVTGELLDCVCDCDYDEYECLLILFVGNSIKFYELIVLLFFNFSVVCKLFALRYVMVALHYTNKSFMKLEFNIKKKTVFVTGHIVIIRCMIYFFLIFNLYL